MLHLAVDNGRLLVVVGNKLILIDTNYATKSTIFTLPQTVSTTNNTNTKNADDEIELDALEGASEDGNKVTESESADVNCIQQIILSPNRQYLALTATVDKLIYLFQYSAINENPLELLSTRNISRTASVVRFADDSESILLADKSGDCYLYDCLDVNKPPKWLLAHLSMVLDVMFTNNKSLILTCDRDEKIRITKYPETHLIDGYCLGHVEYVSRIEFLPTDPNEMLVSVSGDKTVKLWQLNDYQEIAEFQLDDAPLQMAIKMHGNANHIALTYMNSSILTVHRIVKKNDLFEMQPIGQYEFQDLKLIVNIEFYEFGSIILYAVTKDGNPILKCLKFDNGNYEKNDVLNLNQLLAEEIDDSMPIRATDNATVLFKKRFDNVQDYQERKKRRIEEKNKTR